MKISLRVTFKHKSCLFKVPFHKGIWSQFGFTFKDSVTTLAVYHNGKRVSTQLSEACQVVSATQPTNHTLIVGMATQKSVFQIDDLVIWDKWLNESEFVKRYQYAGGMLV